jgi:hypothetical protein
MKSYRSAFFLLAVVMTVVPLVMGEVDKLLNRPVSSFVRDKSNVANIAAGIATALSVPIGFEGTPADPQKEVTVVVSDTTVKVLLDTIVHADSQYEWTVAGEAIINIYPRNKRDRFLDVIVPRFTLQDKTRGEALQALTDTPAFALLLHELHANLRTPFSGPPNLNQLGPKISIDLRNAPMREILNTIVTASHGFGWAAVRYGDHLQYLSLSVGG